MIKEHINIIKSYLDQAISGLSKENPKFDFKKIWYDLTDKKGINEFLKDTSGIANTFGPDGFIIIGFDDKTKLFNDTCFADCGLKDSNEVYGIINKRVDRLFEFDTEDIEIDGNRLSVIHIPPSLDKPHVIRNYQTFDKDGNLKRNDDHKIFVRKNTSTLTATKYDLELMYYDRKNIIPEYKLIVMIDSRLSRFSGGSVGFRFSANLSIENVGLRPVSLIQFDLLTYYELNNPSGKKSLSLTTDDEFRGEDIVVNPNQMIRKIVKFININFPKEKNKECALELNQNIVKSLEASVLKLKLAQNRDLICEIKLYE